MSTSTTTVPTGLTYSYEDRAAYTVIQQFIQTGTWVCPVGITSVLVECWGAGGGGGGGDNTSANIAGGAGGGGAYSQKTSLSVTPGTSYTVTVGTLGSGGAGSLGSGGALNGSAGNDSWFSTSGTVLAKGGGAGGASNVGSNGTGGTGGAAASGIGDITTSGGDGGTGDSTGGLLGPGGGSGGDKNSGGAGITATGAAGKAGATVGGLGGNNAIGRPPGGGGAGGSQSGNGKDGAAGLVQLTYTTTTALPTSNTNLQNPYTNPLYGNVAIDDGDYFIEFGSEYVISEFKYKNPRGNNTDSIQIKWLGRTTESTVTSPILLQIYNQNSAAWETIAKENRQLADVDFLLCGKQTANLSNYYDSTNTVSARIYQLVI